MCQEFLPNTASFHEETVFVQSCVGSTCLPEHIPYFKVSHLDLVSLGETARDVADLHSFLCNLGMRVN